MVCRAETDNHGPLIFMKTLRLPLNMLITIQFNRSNTKYVLIYINVHCGNCLKETTEANIVFLISTFGGAASQQ